MLKEYISLEKEQPNDQKNEQDKIENVLGLKVNIMNKSNNSGKIVIQYEDLEQFEFISSLLKKR